MFIMCCLLELRRLGQVTCCNLCVTQKVHSSISGSWSQGPDEVPG